MDKIKTDKSHIMIIKHLFWLQKSKSVSARRGIKSEPENPFMSQIWCNKMSTVWTTQPNYRTHKCTAVNRSNQQQMHFILILLSGRKYLSEVAWLWKCKSLLVYIKNITKSINVRLISIPAPRAGQCTISYFVLVWVWPFLQHKPISDVPTEHTERETITVYNIVSIYIDIFES